MDPSKLKQINQANADKALADTRHQDLLKSGVDAQNTVLSATASLIRYMEGHITKTQVINQLKQIGTPDVFKVVEAVQKLEKTQIAKQEELKSTVEHILETFIKAQETGPQFTVGIYPSGQYKPKRQYRSGDVVVYKDDSYVAIRDNADVPTADSWEPFITKGIQGIEGKVGIQGEIGPQGKKGDPGPKGDKGDMGPIGIMGSSGERGLKGLKGVKGDKGPKGDKGDDGINGRHGMRGFGIAGGGTTGQALIKASDADYDTTWGAGGGGTWGSITGTLASQTDLQSALDAKLDDSQLDTDGTLAANSDAKIASQKATKTYIDNHTPTINDADATTKGILKLTNDLGGTAALPQVVATHLSAALPINQGGTGNTSGTATINANLTGDVTSVGNATTLAAGSASNLNSGTLPAGRMPALTGDVTTSAGAVATTLATVNSNVGSFGSATQVGTFTVNGKGLTTAAGNTTVTPAVGSITGLGTGVSTFLGTPSSANLASAVTDETGSGALVFGTSPTITTGALGSSTATTQTPADNSTKLATTAYVDSAVLGQNFKEACLVATTANLVGLYVNGVFTYTATGTDSIDGVTLALGNRVLVKNQTTTFQNGIYSVTTAGALGVAGVLTRTTDANQSFEFKTGDSVFITSGTTNSSTTWAYTGADSPTIGTDAITYVQTAGQGTVTAGNGISVTGLSVAIDTSVTVDKTTAQTLTNKTLTTPKIASLYQDSIGGSNLLTMPATTDTLVGKATTDTLTNKTLTSPVLNTGVSGTAIDTDSTMAANSDTILASQKATKTALALKAPLASPTFTGTTTAPEFSASGLTGATAASRYVGATASGAPVSGTFAIGDYVIDQTGSIWLCTVAGSPGTWVNPGVSVQSTALQLSLTETVNYQPNTRTKGNTSLYISQSETLQALPKVSSIAANGAVWTITFASSILGTFGAVNDTFQGWTTGFVPTGWNTGSSALPVTCTITSSTTATLVNATSPAAATTKGSLNATPVQYYNTNVLGPPAILQLDGTNTFKTSVSQLYGVGVGIQDQMNFINGTIYSASCSVTNGSNQIKILGTDARSSVFPMLRAVVPTGTPPTYDTTKLDATAYINDVGYDGTDTIINLYKANTVTVANWLGSTGTATIYFPVDITAGEQLVFQPITYATGAAPVSFVLNPSNFGKPGEGQGWAMGPWYGAIHKGFTTSDAIVNINDVGFIAECTFGQGAIGIQRIGYFVDDVTTTRSQGSSANQGSVAKQIGVAIGGMTADATDYYPFVGALTANNNIGLLNTSTTYYPGVPAVCYATVAVTLEPSRVVTDGVTSSAGTTKTVTSATAAFTTTDVGANITGSADIPAGSTIVTRNSATSIEISQAETGSGSGRTLTFGSKTVTVDSTVGFPSSGTFLATTGAPGHYTTVTYTGTTSTTFTGCTVASSTATIQNGVAIFAANKYQDVSAGTFTVQAYGTTVNLWSSAAVSSVTGSAVISTGTPAYDGQWIKIVNVSSSLNNMTFATGGSTGIASVGGSQNRVLGRGGTWELSYSTTLALWQEQGYSPGDIGTGLTTIHVESPGGTVSATTVETSLLSGAAALTNLFPKPIQAGDMFHVKLKGRFNNNSGTSTYTSTIGVYYGAYLIYSQASAALTSSANDRRWEVELQIYVKTIGAANTGRVLYKGYEIGVNTVLAAATSEWQVLAASTQRINDGKDQGTNANLITNAAQNFNVTATHSNNNAAITTSLDICEVLYLPKGY